MGNRGPGYQRVGQLQCSAIATSLGAQVNGYLRSAIFNRKNTPLKLLQYPGDCPSDSIAAAPFVKYSYPIFQFMDDYD